MKVGLTVIWCVLVGFIFGQKPMMQLTVEPKSVQVGEEFNITLKYNIDGKVSIDLPKNFQKGGDEVTMHNKEIDMMAGKIINLYMTSQSGSFTKEGEYQIGPAYIKSKNKVYKSNVVTVKVEAEKSINSQEDISFKQLRQPAFGLIIKNKSKAYVGEPILFNAKVYARFYPDFIGAYELFGNDEIQDRHAIGKKGKIYVDQALVKGIPFYTLEYGKEVVYFDKPGKYKISPFKLNLSGGFDEFSFRSASSGIEILPLPANAPKTFSGAVGLYDYSIQFKNTKQKYQIGDVVTVELTLKGNGNIHALEKPKLTLPIGLSIYGDPVIEDDIQFDENGAHGKVSYTYNIQIEQEHENLKIQVPDFTFFDVAKDKYITLKGESLTMRMDITTKHSQSSISNQQPTHEDQVLNVAEENSNTSSESNVWKYLFFGLLGTLLIIYIYSRKNQKIKSSSKNTESKFDNQVKRLNENQNMKELNFEEFSNEELIQRYEEALKYLLEKKNKTQIIINRIDLIENLRALNEDKRLVDEIIELLNLVDSSLYSVSLSEISVKELSERLRESLDRIKKNKELKD